MRSPVVLFALVLSGAPAAAGPSDPLVDAIELPARAQAVRARGVPAEEVKKALHAARGKGLGADEASQLLEAEEKEAKDGKIPNFGDFVQSKLDEGLRGRELAAAIHEEHARLGRGGGPEGKAGKGPPEGKGPDGDKGPPEGKGPDGDKGPPEGKGPEGKAKGKGKSP